MNKNLEILKNNNPELELKEFPQNYAIFKPWSDDTFAFIIPKTKRIPNMKGIFLYPEFSSIYNKRDNIWEFIYTPAKKKSKLLTRSFNFNFNGSTFKCHFNKSTRYLKFFAENFRQLRSENETGYRNLRQYKDYYSKDKPSYIKEYFKNREPYSFFVEGPLNEIEKNKVQFTKTLNFYLSYYDREMPTIQVFSKDKEENKTKIPCYTLFDQFPNEISASKIDTTLLDILSVANKTKDIRLEFIFYYQIIEYAAYYYLENEDNSKLRQILKRPDINSSANDYVREIMEVLSDHFNVNKSNDREKIHKTIKHYCSINDIKLELKENKETFKLDIKFDGGLTLKSLFSDESAIESSKNGILNLAIDNISKIRNVIVHLREKRENTVILPTEKNNRLLLPYLYILRRISEKIAIQFE
jgi:hypothetical protein